MRLLSLLLTFFVILYAQDETPVQIKHPIVIMQTTQGSITLELFEDVAPLAVENFITHIKNGYYN